MYDLEQTVTTRRRGSILYILFSIAVLVGLAIFVGVLIFQFRKSSRLDQLENALNEFNISLEIFQLKSQKGQPNGYVPLNESAIVPEEFIPVDMSDLISYLGCWNASTNDPVITSGVGENGNVYTVCSGGNTTIDGVSEWFFQDQLLFLSALGSWVRLDGGPLMVNQPGPGIPIFTADIGTPLTMKKFRGDGDLIAADDTLGRIILTVNDTNVTNTTITFNNIGGGVEIVSDAGPVNVFNFSTIRGQDPIVTVIGGSTVLITSNAVPPPAGYDSGLSDMDVGPIPPSNMIVTDPTEAFVFGVPGLFWFFTRSGLTDRVDFVGQTSFNLDLFSLGILTPPVPTQFSSFGVAGGSPGFFSRPNGNYLAGFEVGRCICGAGSSFEFLYHRRIAGGAPVNDTYVYNGFGAYVDNDLFPNPP